MGMESGPNTHITAAISPQTAKSYAEYLCFIQHLPFCIQRKYQL